MLSRALALGLLSFSLGTGLAAAEDVYPNVAALKADKVRGRDYRTVCEDRHSAFMVLAIHGGAIERGTSRIAGAIASADWNLYRFEGLQKSDDWQLHVTSIHFDDPCAVKLTAKSEWAVSVHGMSDSHPEAPGTATCVGGGNAELRRETAEALHAAGFEVVEPCHVFPGNAVPGNIVNRAREQGVELELTLAQRDALVRSAELMKRYSGAVRATFEAYRAAEAAGTTRSMGRLP